MFCNYLSHLLPYVAQPADATCESRFPDPKCGTGETGLLIYDRFEEGENDSGIVGGTGDFAAGAGPVGVDEFASGPVDAFVGMGAEIVALSLQQVGR